MISRQRPPADLAHILSPTTGFSFPSGHAVFFAWMAFMIAVSLAPKIRPAFRPILWTLVVVVIVLTCMARVWAGAHWPSDVIGGVLLGIGWWVVAVGLDRIYAGTHWPSDVLAGALIAIAWLTFVMSVRRISDRALATGPVQTDKPLVQRITADQVGPY